MGRNTMEKIAVRLVGAGFVAAGFSLVNPPAEVEACYVCYGSPGTCTQFIGNSGAYNCTTLLGGGCLLTGNDCMGC